VIGGSHTNHKFNEHVTFCPTSYNATGQCLMKKHMHHEHAQPHFLLSLTEFHGGP
jgi:hypothetical protein